MKERFPMFGTERKNEERIIRSEFCSLKRQSLLLEDIVSILSGESVSIYARAWDRALKLLSTDTELSD